MKDIKQSDFITAYPVVEGDDMVIERRFEANSNGKGKVWINKHRYFDMVPEKVWNLIVSGYQPMDKWLKDRIGTELCGDDIRHYQKMTVALTRTIDIISKIDMTIRL